MARIAEQNWEEPWGSLVAAGFREAVTDAEALAQTLTVDIDIPDALAEYEFIRLESMRRSVQGGQSFSCSFTG